MKNFSIFSKSEKHPGELDIWSAVLPIAFDLICGILLILLGNLALRVTSYALAGAMLISAAVQIAAHVRAKPLEKITQSRLAIGLALTVCGILLAFNPNYLDGFLPLVWGLALLFGAFLKIQYAFDEKALGIDKWWIMLILAAFSLVVGILSLVNPAFLGDSRNLVIGIMLIVEAVIDFTVYMIINKALKKYRLSASARPAAAVQPVAAEEAAPAAVPVPEVPSDTE